MGFLLLGGSLEAIRHGQTVMPLLLFVVYVFPRMMKIDSWTLGGLEPADPVVNSRLVELKIPSHL